MKIDQLRDPKFDKMNSPKVLNEKDKQIIQLTVDTFSMIFFLHWAPANQKLAGQLMETNFIPAEKLNSTTHLVDYKKKQLILFLRTLRKNTCDQQVRRYNEQHSLITSREYGCIDICVPDIVSLTKQFEIIKLYQTFMSQKKLSEIVLRKFFDLTL